MTVWHRSLRNEPKDRLGSDDSLRVESRTGRPISRGELLENLNARTLASQRRMGYSPAMQTVFKVHLRPGADPFLSSLSGVRVVSVEPLDSRTVRLTVAGEGNDAEQALRRQKDSAIGYERLRQV